MKSTLTILMLLLGAPSFADTTLAEISHDIDGDGDQEIFQLLQGDGANSWKYSFVIYGDENASEPIEVAPEFITSEMIENGVSAHFTVERNDAVVLHTLQSDDTYDVIYSYVISLRDGEFGISGISRQSSDFAIYEAQKYELKFKNGVCEINYLTGEVQLHMGKMAQIFDNSDFQTGLRSLQAQRNYIPEGLEECSTIEAIRVGKILEEFYTAKNSS